MNKAQIDPRRGGGYNGAVFGRRLRGPAFRLALRPDTSGLRTSDGQRDGQALPVHQVWLGVCGDQGGQRHPGLLWAAYGAQETRGQLLAFPGRPMANQLGKRYECSVCGTLVLCTKAGEGTVQCCDQEMVPQQPRQLPSSD